MRELSERRSARRTPTPPQRTHRMLAVVACCLGLQLPAPLLKPRGPAPPLFGAVLLSSPAFLPLPAAAAMPTTSSSSWIEQLFIRDGVDAYYGVIAVVAIGYYGFKFIVDTLAKAKEQDEEVERARLDGRSDLSAAFKAAREKKEREG